MNTKTRKTEPTDAAELTTARIRVLKDERPRVVTDRAEAKARSESLDRELYAAQGQPGRNAFPVFNGRSTLPWETGEARARLEMFDSRLAEIDRGLSHLEAVAAAEAAKREAQHAMDTDREQIARIRAECEAQTQRRADLADEAKAVEADLAAAQNAEADALVAGKPSDPEAVDRIARRLDTTRRALARLDDALAGAQREVEALEGRCEALQAEIDAQQVLVTQQAFDAALAALLPAAAEFKRAKAKQHGWYASTLPDLDAAAMAHIRAAAEAEG